MYALEERIKAVEMYFRYGRKVSAVIRELGYPDRKILVKWVREYEETGKLHERCAGSNRYSQEEKQEAVDFYLRHGKQISYTIRSLGYPSREKLMEWIDELAPRERIIHEGYLKRDKHPSMEKKKDCVMRLATRTGSAEEAAKEAGVSRSSLYTWKREIAHDINISMSKRKTEDTQVPIIISSIEEAEEIIARYEKSIAELEEKNRDLEERRLHAEIELACFGAKTIIITDVPAERKSEAASALSVILMLFIYSPSSRNENTFIFEDTLYRKISSDTSSVLFRMEDKDE